MEESSHCKADAIEPSAAVYQTVQQGYDAVDTYLESSLALVIHQLINGNGLADTTAPTSSSDQRLLQIAQSNSLLYSRLLRRCTIDMVDPLTLQKRWIVHVSRFGVHFCKGLAAGLGIFVTQRLLQEHSQWDLNSCNKAILASWVLLVVFSL